MKSGLSAAISFALAAISVYLSEVFGGNTSSENVTLSRLSSSDMRMASTPFRQKQSAYYLLLV